MSASVTMAAANLQKARPAFFAYIGAYLFVLVYCVRPQEWIPGAAPIPFARISGILAILSFGLWFLFARRNAVRLPREIVWLLLLFGQFCLAVPFSIWRGGSFELVMTQYSKIVLVALVLAIVVASASRLWMLFWVHAVSMGVMIVVVLVRADSVVVSAAGERLMGVVSLFEDPNELALNAAVILPVALALLLRTRNPVLKLLLAGASGLMAYIVLATLSRAGFLALLAGGAISMWQFGRKQRRPYLLLATVLGVILLVALGPSGYAARISTIIDPERDLTGSAQARKYLFGLGLDVTAQHPVFGVGPGNFAVMHSRISGDWHGTHSTFLQLSSEAGLPALLLYLGMMASALLSLRKAKILAPADREILLLSGALQASLGGFLVGALFLDFAYVFLPYFLVSYASALYQIAMNRANAGAQPAEARDVTLAGKFAWRTSGK